MIASLLATAACAPQGPTAEDLIPEYRGVETELLQGDLVQFQVAMTNAIDAQNVANYAECAAAGYTLVRGFGFAQHIKTDVAEDAGIWTGDATYLVSETLPAGIKKIDAEVVVANCREKGIPLV
ncbi:MAG: hypothetical protein AAF754_02775 [Pseudomonadota bacterium]